MPFRAIHGSLMATVVSPSGWKYYRRELLSSWAAASSRVSLKLKLLAADWSCSAGSDSSACFLSCFAGF